MNAINTSWNRKSLELRIISRETSHCLPQPIATEGKLGQPSSRSVELGDWTGDHNNFEDKALMREMLYFDRF